MSTAAHRTGFGSATLDIERIQRDLPILAERIHGKQLVYLDNAATSQKPRAVIDAIVHYYEHLNANIHRGVHTLSVNATEAHVTDVGRRPGDLAIQRHHVVLQRRHAHKPRADGFVDERRVCSPTMGVAVRVFLRPAAVRPRGPRRSMIGRFASITCCGRVVRHLVGEAAMLVDGTDDGNPGCLAGTLVVLAEARSHLHDARCPRRSTTKRPPSTVKAPGALSEIPEQWPVFLPYEV